VHDGYQIINSLAKDYLQTEAQKGGAVIRYSGIEYMVIRYMFFHNRNKVYGN